MNNINILIPIAGDQKFGKRIIWLLSLFIIGFIIFFILFRSFPDKYVLWKNSNYNNIEKKQFLYFNNNKNSPYYVWNGIYKNLESLDYFILKSTLVSKSNHSELTDYKFNSYIRIFEKSSPIIENDFSNPKLIDKIINQNYKNDKYIESTKTYYNYFEIKNFDYKCFKNRCQKKALFDIKIGKFKNILVQIYFFKNQNLGVFDFVKDFKMESFITNKNYKNLYIVIRTFLTVLAFFYYLYYYFNIKKVEKKYYTFEHKFLKYFGITYLFYNDPLFFLRFYLGSFWYSIIYSLEWSLFIVMFLYFNLCISIKMNHYEKYLDFISKNKFKFFFMIYYIFLTCLIIYIEMTLLYVPISIFKKPRSVIYIGLIIVNFIIYTVIFIYTYFNLIQVLTNWRKKLNRTKGLVIFTIFFNLLFFGNMFNELVINYDPFNSEIVFYIMINYYIMFLFLFYSFKNSYTQNKNTKMENIGIEEEKIKNEIEHNETIEMDKQNIEFVDSKQIDFDKFNLKEFQK